MRCYKNFIRNLTASSLSAVMIAVTASDGRAADYYGNYVTLGNVDLRALPESNSEVIEIYSSGTIVDLFEYDPYSWSYVRVNGQMGYMKSEFIISEDELEETLSKENEIEFLQEEDYFSNESEAQEEFVTEELPDIDIEELSQARGEERELAQQEEDENLKFGNVELLTWSEARDIFTIGIPATVIDVRTGLTYEMASFSNGNHADVEPVTPEDTAIFNQTYDGVWSWDTRPVVVKINGHSIAASINGMPHGGGVNSKNNMNGQVCIHFKGSTTHNGSIAHERDQQASVMEAWQTVGQPKV